MSVLRGSAGGFTFSPLVPELLVGDLAASLRFWCGLCDFVIAYERPEEGFAYLDRDHCQVMLEDLRVPGRHWITGSMERPFGRGINLQIAVDDAAALDARIAAAGWPIYLPLEEKAYRTGHGGLVVRQFAVQDPDGYLLRFSERVSGP